MILISIIALTINLLGFLRHNFAIKQAIITIDDSRKLNCKF